MDGNLAHGAPPSQGSPSTQSSNKAPVVRGARACTVCRQAKMRCIGAEDGKPCQRCKKANVDCVFEKHRRGRKPGSKLSEASKMLRRLEKGLNTAKLKSSQGSPESTMPFPVSASRTAPIDNFGMQAPPLSTDLYSSTRLPSMTGHSSHPQLPHGPSTSSYSSTSPSEVSPHPISYNRYNIGGEQPPGGGSPRNMDMADDEEEEDGGNDDEDGLFPSRLLAKERPHFLSTVLDPSGASGNPSNATGNLANSPHPDRKDSAEGVGLLPKALPEGLHDPISAGLIDEAEAKVLFDLVFLRLNPFICLFDPVLHTVGYVRHHCPFLFTCLIMAGCKYWKPELYKQVQRQAYDFANRAFADGWRRVEVVQGFACLTYWKEPDDTNTWMYIGFACRMAVELGLNRWMPKAPEGETEQEKRERRNRERTYLVLFTHDRSLSMQTGRQWMLPEDDLVRHASTWHEDTYMRPEDVMVAALCQLRRMAAETTDVFYLHKGAPAGALHSDVNYEILLLSCNGKLTHWMEVWQGEMKKAGGQLFHLSYLSFFRLHVRLFLNSFGLQSSINMASRQSPSLQALSACYTSALQTLSIVTAEFAPVGMLRYVQDSITVMTAYSAVFLLRLLRRTTILPELHEGAQQKIYDLISATADAYEEASMAALSSSSAAYHARFLRSLVAKDMHHRARQQERRHREEGMSSSGSSQQGSDPRSPGYMAPSPANGNLVTPPNGTPIMPGNGYPATSPGTSGGNNYHHHPHHPPHGPPSSSSGYHYNVPAPRHGGPHFPLPADGQPGQRMEGGQRMEAQFHPPQQPQQGRGGDYVYQQQPQSEMDAQYWNNMFVQLGFNGSQDPGYHDGSLQQFGDPMSAMEGSSMGGMI